MTMPVLATTFASSFGGGELVLVIGVMIILFGPRHIRTIARGFRSGISEFLKSADDVAQDAGRSLGGIHGKTAAEALTPDNNVVELYNPAVFEKEGRGRFAGKRFYHLRIWDCPVYWSKELARWIMTSRDRHQTL